MSFQPAAVGETYFDKGSGSRCSATDASGQRTGSLLTGRESRILREISQGASNKQVARLLEISPSTVRTHVENIFRKLDCSTRAAAAFKAATLGLIY